MTPDPFPEETAQRVTAHGHGFSIGDEITSTGGRPWRELWHFIRASRVSEVVAVSPNTFDLAERRMTWREWRAELRVRLTALF